MFFRSVHAIKRMRQVIEYVVLTVFSPQWRWLSSNGNDFGVASLWTKPVAPLMVLAICLHWIVDAAEQSSAGGSGTSHERTAAVLDGLVCLVDSASCILEPGGSKRIEALQRLLRIDITAPKFKLLWPRAVYVGVLAMLCLLFIRPLFYLRENTKVDASSSSPLTLLSCLTCSPHFHKGHPIAWGLFALHIGNDSRKFFACFLAQYASWDSLWIHLAGHVCDWGLCPESPKLVPAWL